ncbi:MAG: TSCPD domain-containing protein, partial [Candidatus Scatosoma sp.]
MFTYSTRGTCSRQILFDVTPDNKLHNVRFIGGCSGNLQGIARLVEGKDI